MDRKSELQNMIYSNEVVDEKWVEELRAIEAAELAETRAKVAKREAEIIEQVSAFSKEKEEFITKEVQKVVAGETNVAFRIVGCDYPYYSPFLSDIDDHEIENEILTRSIEIIVGQDYISTADIYIRDCIEQGIGIITDFDDRAKKLQYDKEVQEYHGYKDTVVTHFEMSLADILKEKKEELKLERDQIEKENAEKKALIDHADKIEVGKITFHGDDKDAAQDILIVIKGKKYSFCARNIFDFGFIINPTYPNEGGIAINVESFIANNLSSFNTEEKKEKERSLAPNTGWFWDQGKNCVEMSHDEILAYKIACAVSTINKNIRM